MGIRGGLGNLGNLLESSCVADALYTMVHRWARRMRGALAIEIFAIVLLMIFPEIVPWLPRLVMGEGG